jgi:hypothetical protein
MEQRMSRTTQFVIGAGIGLIVGPFIAIPIVLLIYWLT